MRALEVLMEPNMEKAEGLLRRNLGRCLLIVGDCSVEYRGRARSRLGLGGRIVIIKEDGALLIHRPTGYEPINWMPGKAVTYHIKKISGADVKMASQFPCTDLKVQATDKFLEVRAMRRQPTESIRMFFRKIHMASVLSLVDPGEFFLYASEEDMQRAVLLQPALLEEGFKPIRYEKRVAPGFVDVYGLDKDGRLVVVEIKRKTAGRTAAFQLAKYLEAVKNKSHRDVRGILVAPNIRKGVQRLLITLGLEFRSLDPKRCAEILRKSETRKLTEFIEES